MFELCIYCLAYFFPVIGQVFCNLKRMRTRESEAVSWFWKLPARTEDQVDSHAPSVLMINDLLKFTEISCELKDILS